MGDKQNSKNGWVTNNGEFVDKWGVLTLLRTVSKTNKIFEIYMKNCNCSLLYQNFLRLHPQIVNLTFKLKKFSDRPSSGRLPQCENCIS